MSVDDNYCHIAQIFHPYFGAALNGFCMSKWHIILQAIKQMCYFPTRQLSFPTFSDKGYKKHEGHYTH